MEKKIYILSAVNFSEGLIDTFKFDTLEDAQQEMKEMFEEDLENNNIEESSSIEKMSAEWEDVETGDWCRYEIKEFAL